MFALTVSTSVLSSSLTLFVFFPSIYLSLTLSLYVYQKAAVVFFIFFFRRVASSLYRLSPKRICEGRSTTGQLCSWYPVFIASECVVLFLLAAATETCGSCARVSLMEVKEAHPSHSIFSLSLSFHPSGLFTLWHSPMFVCFLFVFLLVHFVLLVCSKKHP